MSLIRVTPFAGINGLHRLMDHFWRDSRFLAPADSEEIQPVRRPISDVYETGDSLVFTMELPGFDKSEIEVTVNNGYLEVKGEHKAPEKEDRTYRQVQRWHGRFPAFLPASPQSGSGQGLGRTEEWSPQHRDPQVGSGETQADRGPSQLKLPARGPRNLPPPGPFPLR